MERVAIIGAGAAGCFCAAWLRSLAPSMSVTLFEAGPRPMAKLAITGGGRCNLTNSFEGIRSLSEAYPRGERVMKRALKAFSQEDACQWFRSRGVSLVLQEDHCWFPASQDALDIVRCLEKGIRGAELRLGTPVKSIRPSGAGFSIFASQDEEAFDYVIVTTGGAPKGLPFLEDLDLELVPPVPSLFTFTVPDPALRSLMGLVVEVSLSLPGTSFRAQGPLLITDWGLSGPATLKLSSYAARHLADAGYKAPLSVNWMDCSEEAARQRLKEVSARHPQKQLSSTPVGSLPGRLWEHLLTRSGLRDGIRWAELGSKGLNRLTATLCNDVYSICGKSRFREEFVTSGGVALSNIRLSTLESKRWPGLYFAGEVLDIDAITGGFNLQAAWSTGYVCAHSAAARNIGK